MNEKAPNKKRSIHHRIVGALIKGICWGWALSFCMSMYFWNTDSFEMANMRLVSMMKSEKNIDQTYSDTSLFKFVVFTSALLIQEETRLSHLNELSVASQQLKKVVGDKQNNYLSPAEHQVTRLWKSIGESFAKAGVLAKNNTLMVLGKLLLFVLALPLMGLCWLFGVIDGFALREIRTAELGRESSFIFHRFLGFIPGVLWLLITLYLVSPFWINPVVFFIAVSVMTLLLASRTVSKFKKYV